MESPEACGHKPLYLVEQDGRDEWGAMPIQYRDTMGDARVIIRESKVEPYVQVLKDQLHTYTANLIQGVPEISFNASGARGIFEVYRRLADAERLRKPEAILKLNVQIPQPNPVKELKDMEPAVDTWEHNVNYFHNILPAATRIKPGHII